MFSLHKVDLVVSVCSLVLITVDRFISVVFPFKTEWKISVKQAMTMMIVIWGIVAFLGVFPLMGVPYFQDEFYARSGVCLPLHITAERPPGFEYSVAIFMVFNFIAFVLIMGSYIAMFVSVRSAGKASGEAAGKQKAGQTQTMTTRMTMIVLTDFFCWFPVTLMGIMALTGVALPGEVFAFTAVIILPINSALNPVLYTVLAIKARGKKKPPGPVPPGGKKPGGPGGMAGKKPGALVGGKKAGGPMAGKKAGVGGKKGGGPGGGGGGRGKKAGGPGVVGGKKPGGGAGGRKAGGAGVVGGKKPAGPVVGRKK